MKKELIVVIYSGGMDSYTALHKAIRENPDAEVHALSFFYGQRHAVELEYVDALEYELPKVNFRTINLYKGMPNIMRGGALTTGGVAVPEGHYEAETMRTTVVPGRNTLMLSMALSYAEGFILRFPHDYSLATIWYGAHSGDHHIYPDCRPQYVTALAKAFLLATEGKVGLHAPFLHGTKETILIEGYRMGLDYFKTYTCYQGRDVACGKCGSCQERLAAFAAIGKLDPIEYETRELIPKASDLT